MAFELADTGHGELSATPPPDGYEVTPSGVSDTLDLVLSRPIDAFRQERRSHSVAHGTPKGEELTALSQARPATPYPHANRDRIMHRASVDCESKNRIAQVGTAPIEPETVESYGTMTEVGKVSVPRLRTPVVSSLEVHGKTTRLKEPVQLREQLDADAGSMMHVEHPYLALMVFAESQDGGEEVVHEELANTWAWIVESDDGDLTEDALEIKRRFLSIAEEG